MVRTPQLLVSGLLAACLGACATSGNPPSPVRPLVGPNEQVIETNFTPALECVASHVRSESFPPPRIAVGHITDLTGATDYFAGRRITQGAALMAMTALADSGMRVIERFDMGVIEVELNYAQNGLVRDSSRKLREVEAGQLEGADLYIVGGITEFNPNIRSSAAELSIDGVGEEDGFGVIGGNSFTIDVGIDLRLVDVRSSEVLSVRSFRKQVIGRERSAGVFEFLGGNIVDINAGQRAMEPVQTAVRTMVDRAVFEFVSALYNIPASQCLDADSRHAIQSDGMRRRGGDAQVLVDANQPRPAATTTQARVSTPVTQTRAVSQPAPTRVAAPATSGRSVHLNTSSHSTQTNHSHSHTTHTHSGYHSGSAAREVSLSAPSRSVSSTHLAGGQPDLLKALFLSSHSSHESAVQAWSHLSSAASPILSNYSPRIDQVNLGSGQTEFRLLVDLARSQEDPQSVCRRLSTFGVACQPYVPSTRATQQSARALRLQLR